MEKNAETRPFRDLVFKTVDNKTELKTDYVLFNYSRYAANLQNYLNAGFKMENFIFIDGSKFTENPVPELKKLETFLGLRPLLTQDMFYYDNQKRFYCVKLFIEFKDGTIQEGGLGTKQYPQACMGDSKGRPNEMKPQISNVEREILVRYFAPLNRQFFDMIGVEVPSWQCVTPDRCF